MTLFSAAFPIGSFAFSHGLEAAVAEGRVQTAGDVRDWLAVLLSRGSGWNDLVLMSLAHRAVKNEDAVALEELATLATALCGSAERRHEMMSLGAAFLAAASPWTGSASMPKAGIGDADTAPLPVASGAVAALAGLPLSPSLVGYAQSFASSLVSATVRLVPLGQSEWVVIIRDLMPTIVETAERASVSTLDDLGSAAIVSDIAAMRHETLATRLFRS
ncbi:urease accessory protein UreF [Jiella sp. KSK16Y-1]|uniref:Urease accessory protein UreF n=2 Tax=Jiella mangrovi TaxID=2821407 RepID=A0ABS4BBY2_9HYPH|nr:urease accessory protein UreF [Jiella mangrovi]